MYRTKIKCPNYINWFSNFGQDQNHFAEHCHKLAVINSWSIIFKSMDFQEHELLYDYTALKHVNLIKLRLNAVLITFYISHVRLKLPMFYRIDYITKVTFSCFVCCLSRFCPYPYLIEPVPIKNIEMWVNNHISQFRLLCYEQITIRNNKAVCTSHQVIYYTWQR